MQEMPGATRREKPADEAFWVSTFKKLSTTLNVNLVHRVVVFDGKGVVLVREGSETDAHVLLFNFSMRVERRMVRRSGRRWRLLRATAFPMGRKFFPRCIR